ncbi:unnamed protein product, partial [marine sediment metagenome]
MWVVKRAKTKSKKIGILKKKYLKALNIKNCNCPNVYLSPGAEQHIKKEHLQDYNNYFNSIKYIISKPDYLGLNPNVKNGIELVRDYKKDAVLISITINKNGYLYLSSMYIIG